MKLEVEKITLEGYQARLTLNVPNSLKDMFDESIYVGTIHITNSKLVKEICKLQPKHIELIE